MTSCHFEPFIGLRLLVHLNDLRDNGTILDCFFDIDRPEVITFVTTTGVHSFYYLAPKEMKQLTNGDWKLPGDHQRWAYVCQLDSPYVKHWR